MTVLLGLHAACQGCDENAVLIVEEVESLGAIIGNAELLQDDNNDGAFSDDERTFVVNPRAGFDKAIRVRFLVPVPKNVLDPGNSFDPADFITFKGPFPDLPIDITIELAGTFFEDDPDDPTGTLALGVIYDIEDDLFNEDRLISSPVEVTLHLSQLREATGLGFLEDARFFFVVAPDTSTIRPPRVLSIEPAPADLPGWTRPIEQADLLPGEGFAEMMGRLENANRDAVVDAPLSARPAPHAPVQIIFSAPVINFVASIDPEDDVGLRLRSDTPLPFIKPFDVARSETGAGLAPDTVYEISALSKWAFVNVPAISGTQEEGGKFLIPGFSDDFYDLLGSLNVDDEDLYLDTTMVIRTGPIRTTRPDHLGGTNLFTTLSDPDSPTGAAVGCDVQFALPAEGAPAIEHLIVEVDDGSGAETFVVPWDPQNDEIRQGSIERLTGVTRTSFRVPVPAEDFDGSIDLRVTARGLEGSILTVVGHDEIRFKHDVIAPEIDSSSVQTINETQDGELDRLCLVADCDIDHFIVRVGGGGTFTLDADDAANADCIDGQRTYCFSDVDLGLPDGTVEGEMSITVTAVDDVGNESTAVGVVTMPRCESVDKFVGNGGTRLDTLVLPGGRPAVIRSDGRRIRYSTWTDGGWQSEAVFRLPDDTDTTDYGFGLGLDAIVAPDDGLPTICIVEGHYGAADTDATAQGTLRVLKRDPTAGWVQRFEIADVRPIGCSLAAWEGHLAAGYNRRLYLAFLLEQLNTVTEVTVDGPFGLERKSITSTFTWDLGLSAHPVGRGLFFTYRRLPIEDFVGVIGPHPDNLRSPGRIVVGWFDSLSSTSPHEQEVSHPSLALRTAPFPDDEPGGITIGAGPRIVAATDTLQLAYVASTSYFDRDDIVALRDRLDGGLTYLRAPYPDDGDPLEFVEIARDEDALYLQERDGISHVSSESCEANDDCASPFVCDDGRCKLTIGGHLVEDIVYFGRPSLAVDPDEEQAFVTYGSALRDVRLFTAPLGGGTVTRHVVDARVGRAPPQNEETLAVAVAAGRKGYHLAYRNPLAGRNQVEFVRGRENRLFSGPLPLTECLPLWREIVLTEEQLSLTYVDNLQPANLRGNLWDPQCLAGAGELSFPLLGDLEALGFEEETLLLDVLKGIVIQDGRTLLKEQARVCVPISEEVSCDPEINLTGGNGTFVGALTIDPQPEEPARIRLFDHNPTASECPAPAQSTFSGGGQWACIECTDGAFYIPGTQFQCGRCEADQFKYSSTATVGTRPPSVTSGDSVVCHSCPAQDAGDLARGQMPYILTSDGLECSRCPDGNDFVLCASDDGCEFLGDNWRCAMAEEWEGRANAPDYGVCVSKCFRADDDTFVGCEFSGGACNEDTGACEHIPLTGFACRPIGCDYCWQNRSCVDDEDCPLLHTCSGSTEHLSPLCIARPALWSYPSVLPDTNPLKHEAAELRESIQKRLRVVRLPDHVDVNHNVPGISEVLKDFEVTIADVSLSIEGGGEPGLQGRIRVHVRASDPLFRLDEANCSDIELDEAGAPEIDLYFEPFVERKADGEVSAAFALVDVQADVTANAITTSGGTLCALIPPPFRDIGSRMEGRVERKLASSGSELLEIIIDVLTDLRADGSNAVGRCIFVSNDPSQATQPTDTGTAYGLCPDGSSETPYLVKAEEGALRIVLRACP